MSKKKADRITITISPYLKDWITRYVKEQHERYPTEDYYKSTSSFITFLLDSNLKMFEKGTTLEDFEEEPDKSVINLYNDLTFRTFISRYEESIENSKYELPIFETRVPIFIKFRDLMFEVEHKDLEEKFVIAARRLKRFVISNKVTKGFKIEYINDKFFIVIEGDYPNVQFVNLKGIISLCSFLGLKLKNIIINDYTKLELKKTYLFKTLDMLFNERKKLFQENSKKLLNYYNIIQDKQHHLWIRMSKSDDTFITFKDYNSGMRFVNTILEDISKSSPNKKRCVLQLFEKFNWIKIVKGFGDNLFFTFKVNKREHHLEKKIIYNILQKYGEIKDYGNKFLLN
ncbi:MAG: hypothetical protein P8Y70_16060 [Candidatus Lokiarchaeota archaeon]